MHSVNIQAGLKRRYEGHTYLARQYGDSMDKNWKQCDYMTRMSLYYQIKHALCDLYGI